MATVVTLSSWGRLEDSEHQVQLLFDREQVHNQIKSTPGIAYGMGRSYGDVCLNPGGVVWKTTGLNRLISFNEHTGELICEAGVLLQDIQRIFVSRGWVLPVTPGTQLVTVGGAIANDVHGKNHHQKGSFGNHICWIKLIRTDGQAITCSINQQPGWFTATVGGLGLTGIIIEAAIQLVPVKSPWLETETIPYDNLNEFFQLTEESVKDWEYTVSWVDCNSEKGRGLFLRGNFIESNLPLPHKKKKTVPFVPPFSLINKTSLSVFNYLYFNIKKMSSRRQIIDYESFLYPLDNLLEWNRIYGPRGFFQYQTVVPFANGIEAIQVMLKEVAYSGEGSFLTVLKTFGDRPSLGMLSFPRPGITLAIDFPNRGRDSLKLFERLDAIVAEVKGRLYPAKDARMPRTLFEAGYPRLNEFLKYRDPGISSALSRRLLGG